MKHPDRDHWQPVPAERPFRTRELPIEAYLRDLHAELASDLSGEIATYIPELGRADPASFAICLATVDGAVYTVGDADHPFTIQSMSKPFTYGYALGVHGRDRVLAQVGVEPTGEAFNSIVLDEVHNRPFNPMVNAGAIAVAELLPGATDAERETGMLDHFSRLAGRPLGLDEDVYRSEKATGHRNRAIAWMMLNSGMIARDPEAVLDLYFRQCSVLVTCADMARMGATLANDGVHPASGETVFAPEVVRDVLTLMSTCGMYNYAGQWAYEVGMPAKSGVSGGIVAVIPGQLGIAVYSPLLDRHGNSIRGVRVCQRISRDFQLHAFSGRTSVQSVIRRVTGADVVASKRIRSAAERRILARDGATIQAVEVQGALYFASAEMLSRRIARLTEQARFVIIDFTRVQSADEAALALLRKTLLDALSTGVAVALSGIRVDGPAATLLDPAGAGGAMRTVLVFDDLDRALEAFEGRLLQAHPDRADRPKFALADIDLFAGLSPDDIKALETAATSFQFEGGDCVIREGDEARIFFVVAKGSASVAFRTREGSYRRVASIGPGFAIGEMALLDGGRRSAFVFADEKLICYGFSVDRIRELSVARPAILTTLLGNLVKSLSERLRLSNQEIRALQ